MFNLNIKQISLLICLLCTITGTSEAQNQTIGLEDAISMALENNSGLERDQLLIDQQNKLAEAGLRQEPMQLYFTGEEFGSGNSSGIHSFNVFQNFNLPKANRVLKDYYKKGASLAQTKMDLTDSEVRRQVSQAYYQLLYSKENLSMHSNIVELYDDFLSVTTSQLESGETGKIPQLAARSHMGQAELSKQRAYENYHAAFIVFNLWLKAEVDYDVDGELLETDAVLSNTDFKDSPHLQLIRAHKELATAKIATERSQLLPQINSGVKLQTASGNFPLFGYQLGLNIPLLRKSYNKNIEAAEIGVSALEAQLEAEQQNLDRKISELMSRLYNQQNVLEYIETELSPIAEEQREINFTAYEEGQISYVEYLDGLEQVVKVKQQYLMTLYQYNSLRVELDYWLGV